MFERHLPTFLLSVITAVALWVGGSINDLNKNVSSMLEKTTSHEKRLDNLEKRIFK